MGWTIAIYDVVTNDSGAVVSLNRHIIKGRELIDITQESHVFRLRVAVARST
jgi:hypothetical protein